MITNFMLFSDLQKKVATSPIKTWRLLKQLRDEGRMREGEDWQMLARKLYVNVPRFIVELEHMGYANMKSGDFIHPDLKSDEIKKLVEEVKLISSEITEIQIHEEMLSDMKSAEIKPEEKIAPPLREPEPDTFPLKSDENKMISPEIIESKNEVIKVLKDTVQSKDKDIERLHSVIEALTKQNEVTTRQNAWLTTLIAAPKESHGTVKSSDFKTTQVKSDDFSEADLKSGDFTEVSMSGEAEPASDPSGNERDAADIRMEDQPNDDEQALE